MTSPRSSAGGLTLQLCRRDERASSNRQVEAVASGGFHRYAVLAGRERHGKRSSPVAKAAKVTELVE